MHEKKWKVIMDLLTSSSSSSDEELYANLHISMRKKLVKFKQNFRINRDTSYEIISQYKISPFGAKVKSHGGVEQISHEVEILAFIWFAANKSSLRDVSQRFGIGLSTLYRSIEKVMEFLIFIAPKVIRFPKTMEEKEKLSSEFYKLAGFPGVIGCIDGTSIPISTPAHKLKHTYVNRHDIPTITLQGICDNKRIFIRVFTGTPGKVHDARVWKLSDISKEIGIICGNRFHLIGDNA
ncbi:dde superfamily endonuclease [Holotrichia oblita]|uniref:Dde superfamily endonuclease n=1 Tax=Holotrichia oblita TaxID=644536 RepID=A0ACB9THX7_HOLOL|nr:dde superfamily endonuclease [Holotrichia oblita]